MFAAEFPTLCDRLALHALSLRPLADSRACPWNDDHHLPLLRSSSRIGVGRGGGGAAGPLLRLPQVRGPRHRVRKQRQQQQQQSVNLLPRGSQLRFCSRSSFSVSSSCPLTKSAVHCWRTKGQSWGISPVEFGYGFGEFEGSSPQQQQRPFGRRARVSSEVALPDGDGDGDRDRDRDRDEGAQKEGREEEGRFAEEAREAVVKVLLDAGLSQDDAEAASARAPVFRQELVGCVVEMKAESDLLAQEFNSRNTLYQLANHSRGLSPFLESLGVNLSSISKISSSSLSAQRLRLPDLLEKVRYLGKLLTRAEPRNRPLDGLIQSMVKNLTVSIWEDEDIQRTLSFFEKLKQTGGGLGALEGEPDFLIPLLIEAFPQIFKRGLDDQIKPVIRFLDELGIEGENLGKVVLCYPSILLQEPEADLLPRKRNLKKAGVRVQDMGRMVVRYPWLLSKCVGDNLETLAQFLESIKVPKSKVDRSITKYPHLLGSSSEGTLTPMVEHITGYGLKGRPLGRAIAQSPELLLHSREEFDSVVKYLESLGVEATAITKFLRRSPEILGSSIENTLQAKVKVLEELGVRKSKLGRIITFFPEILSMGVESSLLPRIRYLRGWGFTKSEISRMIFKFPPLLGYPEETVLGPKLKFLTSAMGRSVKDVVAYPRYFSHSLEKKIKPRAAVLANRKIKCDLKTMLAKSDDQFAVDFLGFEYMLIPPLR